MKKLLPLLFLLLPIPALAQETRGWSRDLLHGFQVLATQDGHFMVLGSKAEPGPGEWDTHTPYLARYSADGELVYDRYYPHKYATSVEATKMDLMSNGDLWVTGKAFKADGSEYHLLSRINPITGDTLYTKLILNNEYAYTDFYLQPTPTGDRFYVVSFPHMGDIMLGELMEITENFETVKQVTNPIGLHYGRLHPYTNSTPEGYVTIVDIDSGYLIKIDPDGTKVLSASGRSTLAAPTPGGGAITLNSDKGKIQILDSSLQPVSEVPHDDFFGPHISSALYSSLKVAPDGFLIGASYRPNMAARAPYLIKLNNLGRIVWQKGYSWEEGSSLLDLAPTAEGGAVMLLENEAGVRLVKTGSQGDVLSIRENIALANGGISVYPNPVSGDNLNITFPKPFSGTLQLFDQTGRLRVKTTLNNTSSHQLELPPTLAAGIYFMRLYNANNNAFTLRFIKN